MKFIFSILILFKINISAQILPGANTIVVHGVSFAQVCTKLLDSGYSIDKKDNDLQTVRTEQRQYPRYWNATYVINVRVKDSAAWITGTFTAGKGEIWKDDRVYNHVDRKGNTLQKSLDGYPFLLMNRLALSFGKPMTYLKQ